MNENHIEIIDELSQIVNKFCEIACTHHEYAGSLSKELNQSIEKAILDEFNTLYTLHIEKLTAATGIDLFALQTKNAITIPQRRRRWFTFWKTTPNPAAKAVEGKIYDHIELFFQNLLNRTATITELAQEKQEAPIQDVTITTSEKVPANEEPPGQPETPPEKTPAPVPTLAPQKPAETWEEEHAIPYETLAKPSE